MIDRKKFKKVVLTTNGANLLNVIPILEGKVDHVNISRHHYKDSLNEEVFKTKMSSKIDLKLMTNELNKIGIDVTFSAVLNENLNSKNDIEKYIKFAKKCGATQVFFRKPHGTLEPTLVEKAYENNRFEEYNCPVCRTRVQLIEGMNVSWKASVLEPSKASDKIFELIFNQNGKLTKDWEGTLPVDSKNIGRSYPSLNEQCGGTSSYSCGSSSTVRYRGDNLVVRIPKNKKSDKLSKERNLIENLYNFYVSDSDDRELENGDMVIYKNPGHKHDGEEFKYEETRNDGKYKIRKGNIVFFADPSRISVESKIDLEKSMEKFKKVLSTMVSNGDLKQSSVDEFLNNKNSDPFGEEKWW